MSLSRKEALSISRKEALKVILYVLGPSIPFAWLILRLAEEGYQQYRNSAGTPPAEDIRSSYIIQAAAKSNELPRQVEFQKSTVGFFSDPATVRELFQTPWTITEPRMRKITDEDELKWNIRNYLFSPATILEKSGNKALSQPVGVLYEALKDAAPEDKKCIIDISRFEGRMNEHPTAIISTVSGDHGPKYKPTILINMNRLLPDMNNETTKVVDWMVDLYFRFSQANFEIMTKEKYLQDINQEPTIEFWSAVLPLRDAYASWMAANLVLELSSCNLMYWRNYPSEITEISSQLNFLRGSKLTIDENHWSSPEWIDFTRQLLTSQPERP